MAAQTALRMRKPAVAVSIEPDSSCCHDQSVKGESTNGKAIKSTTQFYTDAKRPGSVSPQRTTRSRMTKLGTKSMIQSVANPEASRCISTFLCYTPSW